MTTPLKIIFAGTPEFSIPTLRALLDSEHEVIAVYTQPDRPAGRGRQLTASPIKHLALAHSIPVYQPISLRDPQEQQILSALQADIMIVIAYGLILPQAVLAAPRLGCINVHASLLPRWRGAAPIQRAILTGDTLTGITIMQMDKGLDTGASLLKISCPIHANDTAEKLHNRLSLLGAKALVESLPAIQQGVAKYELQEEAYACYAPKIEKKEASINWSESAIQLDRNIRAFNPWPMAFTYLDGQLLRIWEAEALPIPATELPGTLLTIDKKGIDVATGENRLRLLTLQMPGGKPLAVSDILNARKDLFVKNKLFNTLSGNV